MQTIFQCKLLETFYIEVVNTTELKHSVVAGEFISSSKYQIVWKCLKFKKQLTLVRRITVVRQLTKEQNFDSALR